MSVNINFNAQTALVPYKPDPVRNGLNRALREMFVEIFQQTATTKVAPINQSVSLQKLQNERRLQAIDIARRSALPEPTLIIGSSLVAKEVAQLIEDKNANVSIEIDSLVEFDMDCVFGMDARVKGPNGIHLLPYVIKDELLDGWFQALLPSSSNKFIESLGRTGMGFGFSEDCHKKAVFYAKQHQIPYREVRSTPEGGNDIVFLDPQEQWKAVVGVHTITLTIIGLEEQGYFTGKILEKRAAEIAVPSNEAIRRARNMALYKNRRIFDIRLNELKKQKDLSLIESGKKRASLIQERTKTCGTETDYRKRLIAPVTEEERIFYTNEARIWEAKNQLAKEVIAKDLGVSLGKIAFITQNCFHIDMEMFIDPSGDNIYVDNLCSYSDVIIPLKRIGLNVFVLPGVVNEGTNCISFMNGRFIATSSGPLFVTNGVTWKYEQARKEFETALLRTHPRFDVIFLSGIMETILKENHGGFRCLTWEKPNYSTPLDIIQSYLADEPGSEKRLRRYLSNPLWFFALNRQQLIDLSISTSTALSDTK